jgi:hypothetical protein
MNVTNEREWISQTALRLRQVQAANADAPPEKRLAHLAEEVKRAVRQLGVLDEEVRRRYLRGLSDKFPVWIPAVQADGNGAPVAAPLEADTMPVSAPEPRPRTALELLEGLIAAAEDLRGDERANFARRLRQAGFVERGAEASDTKTRLDKGLVKALLFPEDQEEMMRLNRFIDAVHVTLTQSPRPKDVVLPGTPRSAAPPPLNLVRCIQAMGMLLDQYCLLYGVMWNLWSDLSVGNAQTGFSRSPVPPRQMLSDFLGGQPSARSSEVVETMKKTFFLANGFTESFGLAAQRFAEWFHRQFGPDHIKDLVALDSGNKTDPQHYWQKYCTLMRDYTEASIEDKFRNFLATAMLNRVQQRRSTEAPS